MKKIISMLLSAAILLGFAPAYADPGADGSEGLEDYLCLLYDDFEGETADGWTVMLPNGNFSECYTTLSDGVFCSKMQKNLTTREEHKIRAERQLSRGCGTKTVVRASVGLDETGSRYTNSAAGVELLFADGTLCAGVYLKSQHGDNAPDKTDLLSIVTANATKTVYKADFDGEVVFDGTLYELTTVLSPDSGTLDVYFGDSDTPIAEGISYGAGAMLTGAALVHSQISYNKSWVTNSAARFGYIKVGTSFYIDPDDEADVAADIELLDFAALTSQDSGRVTRKLNLPTVTDRGCAVSWSSSEPDTVDPRGYVTRGENAGRDVTLTATVSKGNAAMTKSFEFYVPQSGKTERLQLFGEDFEDKQRGASAGEDSSWVMTYPSPKSELTDVIYDADPYDDADTVAYLANDNSPPQTYAGYNAKYLLAQSYSGYGTLSFRFLCEPSSNTRVSTTVYVYNDAGTAVASLTMQGSELTVNSGEIAQNKPTPDGGWISARLDYSADEGFFRLYLNGKYCGVYPMIGNFEQNYTVAAVALYSWNRVSGNKAELFLDDIVLSENLTLQTDFIAENFCNKYIPTGSVEEEFELPTEFCGAKISYESADTDTLSVDGGKITPTRGDTDRTAELTAVFDYKGCVQRWTSDINIMRRLGDEDAAAGDCEQFDFSAFGGAIAGRITDDLPAPAVGKYGSSIEYSSSDETALVPDGDILRVIRGDEDKNVTLAVSFKKGVYTAQKSFEITVVRRFGTNLAAAANVKSVSSEMSTRPVKNMLDGDFSTTYATAAKSDASYVILDLGVKKRIGGALLWAESNLAAMRLYASDNGLDFTLLCEENAVTGRNLAEFKKTEYRFVKAELEPQDAAKCIEIAELMLFDTTLTDSAAVAADLAALKYGGRILSDLTLPTLGEYGSQLSWSSDNESSVTSAGKVTRSSSDKTVNLTVRAAKNSAEGSAKFTVTVAAYDTGGGSSGGGGSSVVSSGKTGSSGGFSGVSTPTAAEKHFGDISGSEWFADYVGLLYKKGFVKGDENGNFRPADAISRAEFAVMTFRLAGLDENAAACSFADASPEDWFAPYVGALTADGIVSGTDDGRFLPRESIKRRDAAVMLCRALGLQAAENGSFDGEEIADYARGAVCALAEKGIISGDENGLFRPNAPITRAEAAVMVAKALAL